ncbi:MAG: glycosyltransferase family 39 protein [Chitinispirillaceae bacterium]|nr:glycosyltransferase family 39 protein [Chitinispirillaceae bacterium]
MFPREEIMKSAEVSGGGRAVWYLNDRLAALAIFLAAAMLLFPGLGDRCLWQDEAETALVAKNILRTGLPLAWDGRQLVTQDNGRELSNQLVWGWTPWLQHYTAAFGMAIFGVNSFGARWPFALLGCLSFPFFFLLVRGMTKDRFLAFAAVVVLLTSVQYLLLLRQCRYYALLPVLFFLCLWAYRHLPSKRGVAFLSLGFVLLFYSNYISCAIAATGFLLHAALFRRREGIWKQCAVVVLIVGAGALPWIFVTGFLDRASPSGNFRVYALGTLIMADRYVCPAVILAGLGAAYVRKRLKPDGIPGLAVCMLIPLFFFLPAMVWPNPRYIAFLLPVGALVAAKAIREVHAWKPWLGLLLAAVLIVSNVPVIPLPLLIPSSVGREMLSGDFATGADAFRAGLFKSELWGYAFELAHATRGPDEELVSFVNTNTAPDDLIGISNDWFPVMFHTGRRIAGITAPEKAMRPGWDTLPRYLFDVRQAQWLILRPQSPLGPDSEERRNLLWALQQSGARVEKAIHLAVNDVRWINRPLLSKHLFRMPDSLPTGRGIDIFRLTRLPIKSDGEP